MIGYDNEYHSTDKNLDHPSTPSCAAKRQRQSCNGSESDWNNLLKSVQHNKIGAALDDILHLNESPAESVLSEVVNTQVSINRKSVLFPSIRIIHYTFHLLYEELKLFTNRSTELPYLVQFLNKLSCDLKLTAYNIHYWKDFPEHCAVENERSSVLSSNDLKSIIQWPVMTETPDSIMEYIYDTFRGLDVTPFPFIPNINLRTKAIVQVNKTQ